MSRHWIAIKQETLEQSQDIAEVIKAIAQKNPTLGLQLAKIDWISLRAHIAKQALEETAAHFNIELITTFNRENNQYGETLHRPKGTILGILQTREERLGIVSNNGIVRLFHTRFDYEGSKGISELAQNWKTYFEERRQIRALEAMAKIIGQEVQVQTDEHGTTDIRFVMNKVKS